MHDIYDSFPQRGSHAQVSTLKSVLENVPHCGGGRAGIIVISLFSGRTFGFARNHLDSNVLGSICEGFECDGPECF